MRSSHGNEQLSCINQTLFHLKIQKAHLFVRPPWRALSNSVLSHSLSYEHFFPPPPDLFSSLKEPIRRIVVVIIVIPDQLQTSAMDLKRGFTAIWVVAILFSTRNAVEGRYHYHKRQKKVSSSHSDSGSESPVPPPDPSPSLESPVPPPDLSPSPQPTVPSSPANSTPPSVPSDPYPDPRISGTNGIFDVTSFGAVGDGSTNDTAAFRAAWKAACAVESGTILAPSGYSFMITSTIFSGPCKPGLVFQVTPPSAIVLSNNSNH